MSNTASNSVPAPLTTEETARAIAAAEKAVYDGVMSYAEDADDSDLEVGEDESDVETTPEGFKVIVSATGDGLFLSVTVKLDRNFKVTDDGVETAFQDAAEDAAADAYTYGCESGWRSAME